MKLQTASSCISFAKGLEEQSAKFYQGLSQRYAEGEDIFLSFAMKNKKNGVQIERVYYEVITDAIEGCFAFEIDSGEYEIDTSLEDKASYADALAKAIEIEEKMKRFYEDAAEQSKSLMADVPRVFVRIATKRGERIAKLEALQG
jgi:rubrerythrin